MKKDPTEKAIGDVEAYIKRSLKAGGRFFRMEARPAVNKKIEVRIVHVSGKKGAQKVSLHSFDASREDIVLARVTSAVHNANDAAPAAVE